MYCTKCGAKLPHDARFCMNCGKPVSAIASAKAVELKASPANAAVPTKVVEPAGVSAKTTVPAAASAKAAASTAAPAKEAAPSASSEEAAAPAASSAKAAVSAFASEAADAGRNDASPSDASPSGYSSNASSQNDPARLGSLQSDFSFSDPSFESAAFVDEPEKPCEAGVCDASSASQNSASSKHPETLRGAVNATKHRSRRRVPMVVLVALAMALAAGTAYAAYRVYTDVWLPAQQTQNEQTVEAPEEITYSVETRSMDVSVPIDPYDAPGKREAQKWYYPPHRGFGAKRCGR